MFNNSPPIHPADAAAYWLGLAQGWHRTACKRGQTAEVLSACSMATCQQESSSAAGEALEGESQECLRAKYRYRKRAQDHAEKAKAAALVCKRIADGNSRGRSLVRHHSRPVGISEVFESDRLR